MFSDYLRLDSDDSDLCGADTAECAVPICVRRHGAADCVILLGGALSNILVFLGEEREWLRVDREGENEPR